MGHLKSQTHLAVTLILSRSIPKIKSAHLLVTMTILYKPYKHSTTCFREIALIRILDRRMETNYYHELIGSIKMAQSLYFNDEHCILALPESIYQQWLLVITGMGLAPAQFVFVVSKSRSGHSQKL